MEKRFQSLILKYFTPEALIELNSIADNHTVNNSKKGKMIMDVLRNHNVPAEALGSGTNRYGILLDGYAIKIALDRLGKIDNRREFKYTANLQPYVIKTYEISPDGLLATSEYVNTFSDVVELYENQDEMREILTKLSSLYLIGDIGITEQNFMNWGKRFDGSLCIMDFAYIYSLTFKSFQCPTDGEILEYDDDFVNFKCPKCRRTFTFGELRKRVSKSDEENEIGNTLEQGYILTEAEQVMEVKPEFVIQTVDAAVKTKDKEEKKAKNPEIIKEKPTNYDLTDEEQFELINSLD